MGEVAAYPHTCQGCKHIHYSNPIPVAVALIPVWDDNRRMSDPQSLGLLTVKRKGGRFDGQLALPGGFIVKSDEGFDFALSREVREETGLEISGGWKILAAERGVPDGNLLLFAHTHHKLTVQNLTESVPDNPETYSKHVSYAGTKLCLSLHQKWFDWYIASTFKPIPCPSPGL